MPFHRKIAALLVPGAMLLPAALPAQVPDTPPAAVPTIAIPTAKAVPSPTKEIPPKDKAGWIKRLMTYITQQEDDDSIIHDFSAIAPDLMAEVLKDSWKQLKDDNTRAHLMEVIEGETAGYAHYESENIPGSPDRINPRLLELLQYGATDDSDDVRKRTYAALADIAGKTFNNPNEFLAWRKEAGLKPVQDITRDAVKTLVSRLNKPDEKDRNDALKILLTMRFFSDSALAKGHVVAGANAIKLTAIRRKAALDAGMLDVLATQLHAKPVPDVAQALLLFISQFQPEPAYFARIEPDVQSLITTAAANEKGVNDNLIGILLGYNTDWATAALNKTIEARYLAADSQSLVQQIINAHNPRAIPLLITLFDSMSKETKDEAHSELKRLAHDPDNAKPTGEYWREWWEKNKASLPENVRMAALPKVKTGVELWTERLVKGGEGYGLNYQVKQEFAQQDPELQYQVLMGLWPKLTNVAVRRDLFLTITQPENSESGGAASDKINPHLMEILQLGIDDKSPQVQQQALTTAADYAMQPIDSAEKFAEWRKTVGNKPLADIVRDGAKAFAAEFARADAQGKTDLFERLSRLTFQSGVDVQKKDGKISKRVMATGTAGMRRKAVLEAGLLDTMATVLHDPATPELQNNALTFLAAFKPDDAYLMRVEPDARRIMEAQFTAQDTVAYDTLGLLFDFKGAWTMPLLVKFIQRDYIGANFNPISNALTNANDVRAIPLLIGLMPSVSRNEYSNLNSAASTLADVPYADKNDAAFWQTWWEKNKSKYPEETRNLALHGLKTGAAVVEERILNNAQPYGLDYRAQEALTSLDSEAQYKVLHDVWSAELNENIKTSLLQAVLNDYIYNNPKKANPRLLDILSLGLTDDSSSVQQSAASALAGLTMQRFETQDAYLEWRKQAAGKPLPELVRAGAADFAARFKKADAAGRAAMLETIVEARFVDGIDTEKVNGRDVRKAKAEGLTAIRRKAISDGGLLELTVPLLAGSDENAAASTARFLSNFQPDAAFLATIEEPVKRAYTNLFKKPKQENSIPLGLMLQYHSPWVGELLTQRVQNTYLDSQGFNLTRELMYAGDKRAVPLLIALLDPAGKNEQAELLRQLPQMLGAQYDATHDAAWWRKWWETNKANQPEDVRAMPLLQLKTGQEALAARLVAKDSENWNWEVMQSFQAMDADTQYALLKANWKNIANATMKNALISNILRETPDYNENGATKAFNPHLLDIVSLALPDADEQVKQSAMSVANGIAMREFKDAAAFEAWRKEIGTKPLPDIVRENTRALLTQVKQTNAKALPPLLSQIQQAQWVSWLQGDPASGQEQKVMAQGLTGIRRQVALEMNLPDLLIGILKQNYSPELNRQSLITLEEFTPGKAVLRRVEEEVKREAQARLAKKDSQDSQLLSLLNAYPASWATDATLQLAQRAYGSDPYSAISALAARRDKRVMPTLIAILDDLENETWQRQSVAQALSKLAGVGNNARQDAAWWREWWNKNKASFPEEVRNEKFPDLQLGAKYAKTFSIRRAKKAVQIGGDAKRSYVFVTSGLLINRPKRAKETAIPSPTDFSDIPAADRPGLLVVLSDTPEEATGRAAYWQDVVGKGFGGKYLVAAAVPPQWREKQSPLWLTRKERGGIKEAAFTTEAFAAQIVKDVEDKYPVNPERVFLLGTGAGGPAVYACSLEPTTPFRGFILQGSPFHSASLPPLTTAKGRRYYLLHSPQDKKTPYFFASAAQETLQKAGADVKLTSAALAPDAAPKTLWEAVVAGIKWLESGAVTR